VVAPARQRGPLRRPRSKSASTPSTVSIVSQLHTDSHILNAFVFRRFEGALVTGAQINGDGVGRMDFDLPDFDNDKLRGLDEEINAAIRAGLPVRRRAMSRSTRRAPRRA
jgi:misacylated tRNA(Ala) deacylase